MQMERINKDELWRVIPPEEKFELMARAQAKGVFWCVNAIVVSSTLAVALQMGWLMWGTLMLSPFIFQFAAGKEWRKLRPTVMLEYMAARAAARRYAFTINGRDLSLLFMFRGHMQRVFEGDDERLLALEAAFDKTDQQEVWVALFGDSLVLMSEQYGGARLEFAHLVNDRLTVQGQSPHGGAEYSNERELTLSYEERRHGDTIAVKVTSKYPASLVVFEKKIQQLQNFYEQARSSMAAPDEMHALSDDLDMDRLPA